MLKVSCGRYYENDTKMRNFIALHLLVLLRRKKVLEQEENRQECEGGNKNKPEREICGQYREAEPTLYFQALLPCCGQERDASLHRRERDKHGTRTARMWSLPSPMIQINFCSPPLASSLILQARLHTHCNLHLFVISLLTLR